MIAEIDELGIDTELVGRDQAAAHLAYPAVNDHHGTFLLRPLARHREQRPGVDDLRIGAGVKGRQREAGKDKRGKNRTHGSSVRTMGGQSSGSIDHLPVARPPATGLYFTHAIPD